MVKAFDTTFASMLANGGKVAGLPATAFVISDCAEVRARIAALAKSVGLDVVDIGALASVRYLEPVPGLNIALGYSLGQGTYIARI